MNRLFIILNLLLLGACGRPPLDKPATNGLISEYFSLGQSDSIYKYTKQFPNHTQLAMAIIQEGEIAFVGVKRDRDTLFFVQNSDSVMEIGSITKIFTATLLAQLVQDGKLGLEDKINSYFQFPFRNQLQFSYQELANHSSGLPRLPSNMGFAAIFDHSDPYKNYDEAKLDDYLQNDLELNYPKGSKSEYSNLGMGLLSYALRKQTGLTYEQLVNQMIFEKYQMQRSSSDKAKVNTFLIQGLNESGKPTSNWSLGALIGAGGIYSTVADLSKFAMAQFDSTDKVLGLTRTKTFTESETQDVGLGWFMSHRKEGGVWFWHNGGTGGYSSCMVLDTNGKNGVILLSNVSAYHRKSANIDKLCFALMKSLVPALDEVPGAQ